MKLKSKLILMVTIWEILLTWIVTTTLDYLSKRIARRFKFKLEAPLGDYMRLTISHMLVSVYLPYIVSLKENSLSFFRRREEFFNRLVKVTLRSHRLLHSYGTRKTKLCRYCEIITEYKGFLQKFASDPKLYPPFKFLKK